MYSLLSKSDTFISMLPNAWPWKRRGKKEIKHEDMLKKFISQKKWDIVYINW